jgi:hypothetical protein
MSVIFTTNYSFSGRWRLRRQWYTFSDRLYESQNQADSVFLKGAHINRVYIRVFIWVNIYMYVSIYTIKTTRQFWRLENTNSARAPAASARRKKFEPSVQRPVIYRQLKH